MGVVCLMLAVSLTAQANVITGFGKARLEQTSKVLTKVAPHDEGEDASARGVSSPGVRKLLEAYGDDGGDVKETMAKYGDDATEIIRKHGKMGGEVLKFSPGAAKLMDRLPKDLVSRVMEWKREGKLTNESIREIFEWCARHPAAFALMSSYGCASLLISPKWRAVVGAVCDAGNAVIYFVHHYPVTTVIIALILIGLMVFFRRKIGAGISALLRFPVRLWRWVCRKCFPKQAGEKKETV